MGTYTVTSQTASLDRTKGAQNAFSKNTPEPGQAKLALLPRTEINIRERDRPLPKKKYCNSPTDAVLRLLADQSLNNPFCDCKRTISITLRPIFGLRTILSTISRSFSSFCKFSGSLAGVGTANCSMGRVHIALGGANIWGMLASGNLELHLQPRHAVYVVGGGGRIAKAASWPRSPLMKVS